MVEEPQQQTIYDRIKWTGLLKVVWSSTPFPARLLVLPLSIWVYRGLLRRSSNLQDLFILHSDEYLHSRTFRLTRPRYHRVKRVLETCGIRG